MWDERYTESDQMWSGEPNGALVAEVQGRSPGRALDVGCGEGADAIWLAQQGWDVTALDVSGVALERARAVAKEAGADVRWLHAGLLEAALPAGAYDLVSAQYPALSPAAYAAPSATLSAIIGRTTGTSHRSATGCISRLLAVIPPSTARSAMGTPASARIASTRSLVCHAVASSTARATCPLVM